MSRGGPRLRGRGSGERGMALVVAVAYASVLGLMAAAFITFLHQTHVQLVRTEWNQRALHLAEAGVAQGIANLRRDPSYTGEQGVQLGGGRVHIQIDTLEPVRTYAIIARGELLNGDLAYRSRGCRATVTIASDGSVAVTAWSEEKP